MHTIADALTALRPGASFTVSGDLVTWLDQIQSQPSAAEIAAWLAVPHVLAPEVGVERDRRLRTFPFGGRTYGLEDGRGSALNIAGAGTLALAAIVAGAQAGNLRWADVDRDFTWIANDNEIVPMDAQTTLAFAQAAAGWKARHIRAARALKDLSPIPADYTSDARWA